jgi:hypothetical protein
VEAVEQAAWAAMQIQVQEVPELHSIAPSYLLQVGGAYLAFLYLQTIQTQVDTHILLAAAVARRALHPVLADLEE